MSEIVLKAPRGANKDKKRRGRGQGTGLGCTAGKGNKGQNARSGGGTRPGFEGGQMPLYRRIAQRGFSNYKFKAEYSIINLIDLEKYNEGEEVNRNTLIEKGIINKNVKLIKLLGNGEINKKINVKLDAISKNAKEKIEKNGGSVTICKTDSKKKKKTNKLQIKYKNEISENKSKE